jgi:hypothetical protein
MITSKPAAHQDFLLQKTDSGSFLLLRQSASEPLFRKSEFNRRKIILCLQNQPEGAGKRESVRAMF